MLYANYTEAGRFAGVKECLAKMLDQCVYGQKHDASITWKALNLVYWYQY